VLTVQGGSLAEGIDLPGDALVGAFIVGPALPALSLERECVRAYYDRVLGKGFEYAYVYPAMTRVVQAAGRVIRTPEDRGLVVLCCSRFLEPTYSKCLPKSWYLNEPKELVSKSILSDVRDFWNFDVPC
jgi:DNA excision repair protein ERCC-2